MPKFKVKRRHLICPLILAATSGQAQSLCDEKDLNALNAFCFDNRNVVESASVFDPTERDGKTSVVFSQLNLRWIRNLSFTASTFQHLQEVYLGVPGTNAQRADATWAAYPELSDIVLTENIEPVLGALFLQNVKLTTSHVTIPSGRVGNFSKLILGDLTAGISGKLVLDNSEVDFSLTELDLISNMNTPAILLANSGDNDFFAFTGPSSDLSRWLEVQVNTGASLTFRSNLNSQVVGGGLFLQPSSSFNVRSATVRLTHNAGYSGAQSTIDNATINVESGLLALTSPTISDSILNIGGEFRVYDGVVSNGGLIGNAYFSGDNQVNFSQSGRALFATFDNLNTSKADGSSYFAQGTTTISGADAFATANVYLDNARLDFSGMSSGGRTRNLWVQHVFAANNSIFRDYNGEWSFIETAKFENSTLITSGSFGSYSANANLQASRLDFTDSTLDLASIPPELTDVGEVLTLNSGRIHFSGANQVRLAFDPLGQCVTVSGQCVFTAYNDRLDLNVGNTIGGYLRGIDTLMFLPVNINSNATTQDFLDGGHNGVYTISILNSSSDLNEITLPDGTVVQNQPYDALPRIPTITELNRYGSNLPSNLLYTIVNDPRVDNQIDISFIDVGLTHNSAVVSNHVQSTTNRVIVDPLTAEISTITVSITPDPLTSGATSTTQVVTTTPTGTSSVVSSATQNLAPATGTVNTGQAAKLVSGFNQPVVPSTSTQTISNANNTTTTVTTTVNTNQGGGSASQTVDVIIVDPQGGTVLTNSVTVPLDLTPNTSSLPGLGHTDLFSTLNSIHPEPFASNMTIALEHQAEFAHRMITATGRNGSRPTSSIKAWFSGSRVEGDIAGQATLEDYAYEFDSYTLGVDNQLSPNWLLGGSFGFGNQELIDHGIGSTNLTADVYQVGAYARYESSAIQFSIASSIGNYSNRGVRSLSLGSVNERVNSRFGGNAFATEAELGFKGLLENPIIDVTPIVRSSVGYYHQKAFVESGSNHLELEVDSAEASFVSLGGGIEFSAEPSLSSFGIWPVLEIGADYDFAADDDSEHSIGARLKGAGAFVEFSGQGRASLHRYGEFKLESKVGQLWTVDLSYRLTRHDLGEESSVYFGASYLF